MRVESNGIKLITGGDSTFRDAIRQALQIRPEMSLEEIAEVFNQKKLYTRRNREPVDAKLVGLRAINSLDILKVTVQLRGR